MTDDTLARDFDIVWNGVVDGHDGDMLNPAWRQEDKTAGVTEHRDGTPAWVMVLEVLPTRQARAIDFAVVVARTGLSKQTVNGALYALRKRKLLFSVDLHAHELRGDRAPQKYWRLKDVDIRKLMIVGAR